MGFGFNVASPYLMAQLIGITPPRLVPIAASLVMGGANLGMFFAMDILGFLGRFSGDGLNGILIMAGIIASICSVAAIFLFVFTKTGQPSVPA